MQIQFKYFNFSNCCFSHYERHVVTIYLGYYATECRFCNTVEQSWYFSHSKQCILMFHILLDTITIAREQPGFFSCGTHQQRVTHPAMSFHTQLKSRIFLSVWKAGAVYIDKTSLQTNCVTSKQLLISKQFCSGKFKSNCRKAVTRIVFFLIKNVIPLEIA